jgi:hypothetical protein
MLQLFSEIKLTDYGLANMRGEYYVHLVCPYCHRWKWVRLHEPQITLEDVLDSFWLFECAVHGLLLEKPLQAHESRIPSRAHCSNSLMKPFD